jgi:hypothetical protein
MKVNNKIEMLNSDSAENINHYDYQIDSNLKELGWRLPSIEELKELFQIHKNGIGNFFEDWYMTNEGGAYQNSCIHFGTGEEQLRNTEESHWGCCRVRLVRDI